jgi:putative sterol carrier protein
MGMPFVFNPGAAGDARAVIQFRVSGDEPGDYWLRVQGGQCESFEGMASAADLTVHTPGDVWVNIAHGRLDGAAALMEARYRVEGDTTVLAKLSDWFRAGS